MYLEAGSEETKGTRSPVFIAFRKRIEQ